MASGGGAIGIPPDFRTSVNNEILMANVFRDMELSIGKFATRSDKFINFVKKRPEYPIVLTTVPFTAVSQVLFMVTQHTTEEMFEFRCNCKCGSTTQLEDTKYWNSPGTHSPELRLRFVRLLDAVASKYGHDKRGFLSVAHQVICKIIVGQSMFMAVFTGNAIGPKRLRKLGVCMYPGWDGQLMSFKASRAFEINSVHSSLFAPSPFVKCIFFTFSEKEGRGSDKLLGDQRNCYALWNPVQEGNPPPPSALCDKILQRAHEVFSSMTSPPPFLLCRIYFLEDYAYVTVKVRRVRMQSKSCHYEIFILKGEPYTNLNL